MGDKFYCELRTLLHDYSTYEDTDSWYNDSNGVELCSYCRSISPSCLEKLINEFGYKIVQKSNKDYRLYVNVYGKQYHFYTCHSSNEFNETLYRLVWSNWNKNLTI